MTITQAQFKKIEKMESRKIRLEEDGNIFVGNTYAMVNTKIIKDGVDERKFDLRNAKLSDVANENKKDYEPIVKRIYVGKSKFIVLDKDHTLAPEFECLLDLGYDIRSSRDGIILSFWLDNELMATCATRIDEWKLPEQLR